MTKQQDNIELLHAMETVMRSMNHEDAIEGWLMCGVPDGADERNYEDIASDDELMDSACACFGRAMRRYSKYGLFTNYAGEPPYVAYGSTE